MAGRSVVGGDAVHAAMAMRLIRISALVLEEVCY